MKKFISIFAVIILLFNTLGNLIVFEGMYYSIHKDVRTNLIKNIPDNKLITITIDNKTNPTVRFTDKDEFIYNRKMYDIVKQKTVGNTTIYYCLNDNKEDNLFANLNKDIKNNMDSNPVKNKTQQILKKITVPLFYEDAKVQLLNISFNLIYSSNTLNKNNTYIDVLTPPPISI